MSVDSGKGKQARREDCLWRGWGYLPGRAWKPPTSKFGEKGLLILSGIHPRDEWRVKWVYILLFI